MRGKLLISALIACFALGGIALAQTAPAGSEYDRASGGDIDAIAKQTDKLSGSLGMSMSRSAIPLLSSTNLRNYEASLGGTILKDRLWFFGTAQSNNTFNFNPAQMQMGKMTLNLPAQSITASAFHGTTLNNAATLPSSFLTMHYTGVISPNAFFTATISQSRVQQ